MLITMLILLHIRKLEVFCFFSFIYLKQVYLYNCAAEWTTMCIQSYHYKLLCTFAHFYSFSFFTMKSLSTTLGQVTDKEWVTRKKPDLPWHLLCSCPRRHKLNSESSRPMFNPINMSFPCARIPIICVCLSICGKSDLLCNLQYYWCPCILAEFSALLYFEYKTSDLLNNKQIFLGCVVWG